MRKGELIIESAKTIKSGDVYFDESEKLPIRVKEIKDGVILGENAITGNRLRVHSSPENLSTIMVRDLMTKELFNVEYDQYSYLFGCGTADTLRFFDRTDHKNEIQVAVVLCKMTKLMSTINYIDPIATAYGMYVAGQKEVSV